MSKHQQLRTLAVSRSENIIYSLLIRISAEYTFLKYTLLKPQSFLSRCLSQNFWRFTTVEICLFAWPRGLNIMKLISNFCFRLLFSLKYSINAWNHHLAFSNVPTIWCSTRNATEFNRQQTACGCLCYTICLFSLHTLLANSYV